VFHNLPVSPNGRPGSPSRQYNAPWTTLNPLRSHEVGPGGIHYQAKGGIPMTYADLEVATANTPGKASALLVSNDRMHA